MMSPVVSAVDYKTAGPDISYWINAALDDRSKCPTDGSGYVHCTVILPAAGPGEPYWSHMVLIKSPFVSIIGQGKSQSVFTCTAMPDCVRIHTLPFTQAAAGTFRGFSLHGGNGNGIHIGDIVGARLIDLGLYGFSATGAAGLWMDNANAADLASGTFTERTSIEGVQLTDNAIGLRFTNKAGSARVHGGNPSFGYTRILDLKMDCVTGQTCIELENSVQVYNSTIRANANTAGAANVFALKGTAQFQGELHLTGEGTAMYLFNGARTTEVSLTQDSSVAWGPSSPPSRLSSTSGIVLGPVSGIASRGRLVSLIPSLSITVLNPVTLPGGSRGVTQNDDDESEKLATDAFVHAAISRSLPTSGTVTGDLCSINPNPNLCKADSRPTRCEGLPAEGLGAPVIRKVYHLIGQGADADPVTLYTVPARGEHVYRISQLVEITEAASSVSTTPVVQITFTDNDTGLPVSEALGAVTSANVVGAQLSAVALINAKPDTPIGLIMSGYHSVGSTRMKFSCNLILEALE